MICHHFGMFEFNTVSVNELKEKSQKSAIPELKVIVPSADQVSLFTRRL
jgi:hypothetical protein